jgi:hypothetical protein
MHRMSGSKAHLVAAEEHVHAPVAALLDSICLHDSPQKDRKIHQSEHRKKHCS